MEDGGSTYIAIDLKSYYASVECVERGLDPLDANLVVADESRTDKTICLAVSPTLKAYGISGRARLFEVRRRLRQVNAERRRNIPGGRFTGRSFLDSELREHPDWEVDLVIAIPRMAYYIEYSTRIYNIYLKYVSAEDIQVYSIDEVFIDITSYLRIARMSAHDMAMTIIRDVLRQTGITATAGIGTNMYLAKIAMDIVAKHMPADADGVRIAQLDEMSYRRQLWSHRPLTDFWRVGRGTVDRLAQYGINTMGQLARVSLTHESLLYQLFGVNAELLIDHAWGWEPTTIAMVKAYRPATNSISSGQVLSEPYDCKRALVVVKEMAEGVAYDLLSRHMVTDQIELTVGYDAENLRDPESIGSYRGGVVTDRYGRATPKHAHGAAHIHCPTSSIRLITEAVAEVFGREVDPTLLIRRLTVTACNIVDENKGDMPPAQALQLDLFTDYRTQQRINEAEREALAKERRLMEATLALRRKFGKNALLRGLNFDHGATARQRNSQIGGHKA